MTLTRLALTTTTTISTGLGPKNLVGGGLLDPGPGDLVEHLEQVAGLFAGFQGRASQGRPAGSGFRPGHDVQESPSHAQADPLGLGDGGELVLLLGRDLDGVPESLLEVIDLGLPLGQLLLKLVDLVLDRGAIDGIGDLLGLAIERLGCTFRDLIHSALVSEGLLG